MSNHKQNLIAAVAGLAKFHLSDPADVVVHMDTPEELYCRWTGAYIKRSWFLSLFSPEQSSAMAEFDDYYRRLGAKYNAFPPLLKFIASMDGRELVSRADALLAVLRDDAHRHE